MISQMGSLRLETSGTVLYFNIENALPTDPYILKGVDGVGPSAVNASMGQTTEGVSYLQSLQPQNKQIVIRLGLNPNYATGQRPQALRNEIYKMLVGNMFDQFGVYVSVMAEGGAYLGQIQGVITKVEPLLFGKDPLLQLTIDCFSPYFQAANPTVLTVGAGLPSGVASSVTIPNLGDAPSGFTLEMTASSGTMIMWSMLMNSNQGFAIAGPSGGSFLNGDKVVFKSEPGVKNIWYVRGGTAYALIQNLGTAGASQGSSLDWLTLTRGNNVLKQDPLAWMGNWLWTSFTYYPKYWGV